MMNNETSASAPTPLATIFHVRDPSHTPPIMTHASTLEVDQFVDVMQAASERKSKIVQYILNQMEICLIADFYSSDV